MFIPTLKKAWDWRILLTVSFLLAGFSHQAYALKGVVFIHGTGYQTNALDDYWSPEFVDSVMQGNDNPYLVVNCDFEEFIWKDRAAVCVADQIYRWGLALKLTELYIITHSNGANVVRWILSNPTWDARYPIIIQATTDVTAIAPSSGGTPLANAVVNGNVFEQSLGWLLGYASDGVFLQQVEYMAFMNEFWLLGTQGNDLPVPFKVITGTDVESSPFDGDSYCGGYSNQVALEFTQNWLDSCSDGFLECSSQEVAGTTWFRDIQRTDGAEPLSHQQSRRVCFGFNEIIRDDI
ncbi:hypothetical protein [Aliiglaciecola lipolytica]|uniref:Uncharacterized protein n=1 Tax=Aliiglaciecola lipolytica E3 TaxID=1127673 RepID=K6YB87_9ALTE|nr:hypothetical protein [Aliiglaciecola lipolytica]GAC13898.1 conserved hypothetical protein [Aliiglaciecola lipolytica E3]